MELVPLALAQQLRDEYEAMLSVQFSLEQTSTIQELRQRVVELEAERWEPIQDGALTKGVTVTDCGGLILFDDEDGSYFSLPDDVRLCRKVRQ